MSKFTTWFQNFQGERLCRSQLDGVLIQRHHLTPLRAAIALMFGDADADLSTLHTAGHKLAKSEPIECQCCGVQLLKGNDHKDDCLLARQAKAVLQFAQPWNEESLAKYRYEAKQAQRAEKGDGKDE